MRLVLASINDILGTIITTELSVIVETTTLAPVPSRSRPQQRKNDLFFFGKQPVTII